MRQRALMPRAKSNGIELEYDTFGKPDDPALVLIQGFGAQMTGWDEGFCRLLADEGFHVIRFDNRDVGLSSRITDGPAPDAAEATAGDHSTAPYTGDDMADDTAGLLDALGIPAAHVAGASMGGMIAQIMAIRHPERVLSLCSYVSASGSATTIKPEDNEARQELTELTTGPRTREEWIEAGVDAMRLISSPKFFDAERARRSLAASFDRANDPDGLAHQRAAMVATPDRTEALGRVTVPTLVINGAKDPVVPLTAGEATAKAVPGAELLVLDELGHDIPEPLWPQIIDAIATNARKAGSAGKASA